MEASKGRVGRTAAIDEELIGVINTANECSEEISTAD